MLMQENRLNGALLWGDDPAEEGDGPYRTNEARSVRKKYGEREANGWRARSSNGPTDGSSFPSFSLTTFVPIAHFVISKLYTTYLV
jgi:hypothetical protein